MKQLGMFSFFKTVSSKEHNTRLPRASFEIFIEFLRSNWQKLALVGLFALGLFLGARSVGGASYGWQARIMELLRTQRLNRIDNGMLVNALGYLGGDLLFLAVAYLLGLCAGSKIY